MRLAEQVCSLELAKLLKELGVKQESLFYFYQSKLTQFIEMQYRGYKEDKCICLETGMNIDISSERIKSFNDCFSAFTVAELGAMLPACIIVNDNELCFLRIMKDPKSIKPWNVDYHFFEGACSYFLQKEHTETDSRAKMLIYLLENNLIKNEN